MTLPVELTAEISKLEPSAIIELFILDATQIGGDVLRFHAGTNSLRQNLVFQGETYQRYPIEVAGFDFTGQGQFPRPKLRVANILSAITQLVLEFGDLIGAKVTRKRTLAKFLDAENFPGGVNPTEDPTAEFADDVYYIDRKSSEDRDVVEFELASSLDLVGVSLPRRQVIQNLCVWKYRGPECGYTGPPIYDKNDQMVSTGTIGLTADGITVLSSYNAMLAAQAERDAKITLTATASRALDRSYDYVRLSAVYTDPYVTTIGAIFKDYLPAAPYQILMANGVLYLSSDARTNGGPNTRAFLGGVSSQVSLGSVYRQGRLRMNRIMINQDTFGTQTFILQAFELETWGVDSGAVATAQAAYNAAVAAQATAQAAYDAAIVAFNDLFDALSPTDTLFQAERCGKRLASCKLRFGASAELPFGGFPSAGLSR